MTDDCFRLYACENQYVQTYAVIIHSEPEGGCWAEVPALPGAEAVGLAAGDVGGGQRRAEAVEARHDPRLQPCQGVTLAGRDQGEEAAEPRQPQPAAQRHRRQ